MISGHGCSDPYETIRCPYKNLRSSPGCSLIVIDIHGAHAAPLLYVISGHGRLPPYETTCCPCRKLCSNPESPAIGIFVNGLHCLIWSYVISRHGCLTHGCLAPIWNDLLPLYKHLLGFMVFRALHRFAGFHRSSVIYVISGQGCLAAIWSDLLLRSKCAGIDAFHWFP